MLFYCCKVVSYLPAFTLGGRFLKCIVLKANSRTVLRMSSFGQLLCFSNFEGVVSYDENTGNNIFFKKYYMQLLIALIVLSSV